MQSRVRQPSGWIRELNFCIPRARAHGVRGFREEAFQVDRGDKKGDESCIQLTGRSDAANEIKMIKRQQKGQKNNRKGKDGEVNVEFEPKNRFPLFSCQAKFGLLHIQITSGYTNTDTIFFFKKYDPNHNRRRFEM